MAGDLILKAVGGIALAAAGYVGYRVGSNAAKLEAVNEANRFLTQKFGEARQEAEREVTAIKMKQELTDTINECFFRSSAKEKEMKKSDESKKAK